MQYKQLTIILIMLFGSISPAWAEGVQVIRLKVEGLHNPEAIDRVAPLLSWQLESSHKGLWQEAYQVIVASSEDLLAKGQGDLWDSGKLLSGDSQGIPYAGKPLQTNTKVYWKVKVWTNRGESDWSAVNHWRLGLRYQKDWKGRWIGFDRAFPWEEISTFPTMGARYFRNEFVPKDNIKSATAYIIGLGLYELSLNGQKVGDAVLAPTPTDYEENVKYNAFDLSDRLRAGERNAVGVVLGNGRYFTMRQHYKAYKIKNFGFPKLLLNIIINYEDGTTETISTSDQWMGTADGPIRNNNEYDGEYYDANKELGAWDEVGFDDSSWLPAEYVQEPGGDYQAQLNENMKVMKELRPVAISARAGQRYMLDMGQNMVGWLRIRVRGNQGDTVRLTFAESLQEDGELFLTNLRDAKVTDTYILKGKETEIWEPKFTYHGFRFVEVSGLLDPPILEDFVGQVVYDDIRTVGQFETSDPMLNQIYQNAWWGIAGNYKGMPVDCPQRNERQPWLGDRAVGAYGENYMFDNSRLYRKWLEDIFYAQRGDGSIPDVAPAYWRYYSDNMTWPGTYLMIADMLYKQTADTSVIREHYPAMKKWLAYMKELYMSPDFVLTKDSYGDWVVPPPSIEAGRGQNADVKRPSPLISTAYYYYFMNLMIDFATLSGQEEDIPYFQQLRDQVLSGFQEAFYQPEEGYYGDNKMTDNLLPLAFGMVDDQDKDRVFEQLVNTIMVKNQGHLSTGLIGTQWLMRTLSDFGRADLALQLATNTSYPSWGYMVENGASTIWELWHGNVAKASMNSQNHTMLLGDLMLWYYEYLGGIKAGENPGFKEFVLAPVMPEGLDWARVSYECPYGQILSHWERKNQQMHWSIQIPPNTRAIIQLPEAASPDLSQYPDLEGGRIVLPSGQYHFTW